MPLLEACRETQTQPQQHVLGHIPYPAVHQMQMLPPNKSSHQSAHLHSPGSVCADARACAPVLSPRCIGDQDPFLRRLCRALLQPALCAAGSAALRIGRMRICMCGACQRLSCCCDSRRAGHGNFTYVPPYCAHAHAGRSQASSVVHHCRPLPAATRHICGGRAPAARPPGRGAA